MTVFPASAKSPDFRRVDRLRGLVIVGLAFVLCLLISVWAKRRSRPEVSAPPGPPSTIGVVGFPKSVDVVKTLPRARELTRRSLLRGIVADGVKSDGSVDTSDGVPHVRYSFQSPAGQGPQPPREPGTLARRPYCGRQTVVLRKDGLVAESDSGDAICPPHETDPLPEPHCGLAEVWARALAHGAPKDRLARIEYYRASAGPAWRFEAPGPRSRFTLYGDCQRELDARDAANVGP